MAGGLLAEPAADPRHRARWPATSGGADAILALLVTLFGVSDRRHADRHHRRGRRGSDRQHAPWPQRRDRVRAPGDPGRLESHPGDHRATRARQRSTRLEHDRGPRRSRSDRAATVGGRSGVGSAPDAHRLPIRRPAGSCGPRAGACRRSTRRDRAAPRGRRRRLGDAHGARPQRRTRWPARPIPDRGRGGRRDDRRTVGARVRPERCIPSQPPRRSHECRRSRFANVD